ncbi:hypothetical protein G7Z17_g2120 [Cylindrodendrum hubeiense]|uniref:Amino acid permease/ SLC12A domain-containing protein n=1 Tax=Cylindrodendrum hubeiense TaxID=595255 RepID=A0A9P5LKM9_9HYPO|nr:hypothetical protein G7Z17_g2120 [Cylindrodendrum hubeiense]
MAPTEGSFSLQTEKKDIMPSTLSKSETQEVGQQIETHDHGTKRSIKSRQAQMIAIGGSIGTGLFVGSGQALAIAGPGFLLAAYCIMSLLVYGIFTAVIEVASFLPVAGSAMSLHCKRFLSPSLGFALGWLYFYSFGVIVAYEITAASILINYWPNNVHIGVWITIMLIVIVALNLCPVGVYAESEFYFAGLKVIMIFGMLILSVVLMAGGGPNHEALGFKYWHDPGATKEYLLEGPAGTFTAFLYSVVFSGFSFYFSPELIVFTAGEMQNPRKNLPRASRQFFIRLVFFYVMSTIAIGCTCNSNSDGLTSGTGDANASPFVIAIRNVGIDYLPSIINAGILTSAWSSGNAYLYMSSRSIYSLARVGSAPKIFTRCNRHGVPIYAVLASSCFTFMAYLNCASEAGVVFNWFINLTNTAGYLSWILCAIIFLRFRKACETQGVSVPYRSHVQPWATWICLFSFTFLLLANGFTVFYPGQFTASKFLTSYIGIPVFCTLWLGHKFTVGRQDPWFLDTATVDLSTGLAEVEADAEMWSNEERVRKAQKAESAPWWKKLPLRL